MLAYLTGGGAKAEKEAPKKMIPRKSVEKPLPGTPPAIPKKRPGTSGTELDLRSHRIEASTAFARAQKAEQEYRARRQANYAREDVKAAKVHLGEASKQFKAGATALITAIRLMPAVFREKQVQSREKKEKQRVEREKARKEKEERLAKEKEEREVREKEEEEERKKKEEEEATVAAAAGEGAAEEAIHGEAAAEPAPAAA